MKFSLVTISVCSLFFSLFLVRVFVPFPKHSRHYVIEGIRDFSQSVTDSYRSSPF